MKSITFSPLVLPSKDLELKAFIEKNRMLLFESIVSSIEHCLLHKNSSATIFKFENSDFIITLDKDKFLENVEQIYAECVKTKNRSLCSRLKKINVKITKKI